MTRLSSTTRTRGSAKEVVSSFWEVVTAARTGLAGTVKVKQLPWPSWLLSLSTPPIKFDQTTGNGDVEAAGGGAVGLYAIL